MGAAFGAAVALPEGGRAQGLAKGPTVAHLWPLAHKLRMYMWGAGAAVYRQADNKKHPHWSARACPPSGRQNKKPLPWVKAGALTCISVRLLVAAHKPVHGNERKLGEEQQQEEHDGFHKHKGYQFDD